MKIGITIGDPNGIGLEVIRKALPFFAHKDLEFCLIGSRELIKAEKIKNVEIIDPGDFQLPDRHYGQISAKAGDNSVRYVREAIELAKQKKIAAIVTAPINKEAIHLAGINYSGHTEILKEQTGSAQAGMLFYATGLKVLLTTIHVPLADVSRLVTRDKLKQTIAMGVQALQDFGLKNYQIAVAGLNPHAGENGLFGREEIDIICPVIADFQKTGLAVHGPLPADTLFTKAQRKKYDLIIVHYHDQGLTAFKALYFDKAVNITVGLPIIRTSVDHGTAFNIAGKNLAHPGSMIAAIKTAVKLAEQKSKKLKKRNIQ